MKKFVLKKKKDAEQRKRIGYKINYENELNPAQYDAVMHNQGAALVIAGAGTGKTRTLVYRMARLVEDGVKPESILLLTFTRKSAKEMMRRGAILLDGRCEAVSGGTFHSFALTVLKRYANTIGYDNSFNVLDQTDIEDTINLLRTRMKLDKSKRRFPKKNTLQTIFSLTVNKKQTIEEVVLENYPYFEEHIDGIEKLFLDYQKYKKNYNIMDYDDLLINLLKVINEKREVKDALNKKYKYVMVDEYQDTNALQHEIVLGLAGKYENVLAVGDDAQSIYSFRGAEYDNIIQFPKLFEECKIYKIEENYRSTQPILDVTNKIIDDAQIKYEKELYTRNPGEEKPWIVTCEDEKQQSEFIAQKILDLRENGVELEDIAVLFRSGFLSFDLEIELNKSGIPYRKFGGMKFVETAHIKDMMSFFKIIYNPKDAVSWHRALLLLEGVGPRSAEKMIDYIQKGNFSLKSPKLNFEPRGKKKINDLFDFLGDLNMKRMSIGDKASLVSEYYLPILKGKYDDWQKRRKDIDMFIQISERYNGLEEFLNDMALEPPTESMVDIEEEDNQEEYITLSTIHSAKGLEWRVVFVIWALDGRFPSTKAADNLDQLEEERRLFYVACTRARDELIISYPTRIFDRESGIVLSKPSRFLDGITDELADKYIIEDWDIENN